MTKISRALATTICHYLLSIYQGAAYCSAQRGPHKDFKTPSVPTNDIFEFVKN